MAKKETYSYRGWLISDNFLKRAFAIYGYTLVAGLVIMIPVYIIMFLFILIFTFAGSMV
ncbi:hypothetical protein GF351_00870 [Candidatus Woesearchaeota archaeon]|nr:hypothetical protein [Candidatus Woesearchaeota archaeon]